MTITDTPAGEFRKPTAAEIAFIARLARQQNRLKQSVLATIAHVSEKTVERIECGEATLAEETYHRVAEALGLPREAFTQPRYWPTLEEARAAMAADQAQMEAENIRTPVFPIQGARNLIAFFGSDAMLINDGQVDPGHLEQVYALRDHLRDCCDVAGDVPDSSRLTYANGLLEDLRSIEQLGYTAMTVSKSVIPTLAGTLKICLGVLVFVKTPAKGTPLPTEMWFPRNHTVTW